MRSIFLNISPGRNDSKYIWNRSAGFFFFFFFFFFFYFFSPFFFFFFFLIFFPSFLSCKFLSAQYMKLIANLYENAPRSDGDQFLIGFFFFFFFFFFSSFFFPTIKCSFHYIIFDQRSHKNRYSIRARYREAYYLQGRKRDI